MSESSNENHHDTCMCWGFYHQAVKEARYKHAWPIVVESMKLLQILKPQEDQLQDYSPSQFHKDLQRNKKTQSIFVKSKQPAENSEHQK